MTRPRKNARKTVPLISRRVEDANFIHVVRMFPLLHMWAGAITEGQPIDFNDRNMVQMPVEIAEAFIRAHAGEDTELARACRDVAAGLDAGFPSADFNAALRSEPRLIGFDHVAE